MRDRGRGFDPAGLTGVDASAGPGAASVQGSAAAGRRGIRESIEERMHRHGGTATVRSAPGQGAEVELRMPLGTTG